MKARQADTPPRILYFGSMIPGIQIAKYDLLAWPCHVFKTTIPVRSRGELNVFEETVLKLIAAGRGDAGWLTDTTCLRKDLIPFILSRLNDLGMISKHYEMAAAGKDYLDRLESAPPQYEVRMLFRELVGGSLLPVVYRGELRYEQLVSSNAHGATIQNSNAGKTNEFFHRIIWRNRGIDITPPTTEEVFRVANRHRSLSRQFAMLRGGTEPCPAVAGLKSIDIDPVAENVFLSCRIIIQTGSTDFRVTDPFGYGFSDVLEKSYRERIKTNQYEEKAVLRLKERAMTHSISPKKPESNEEEAVLSVFGDIRYRYPELFWKLQATEYAWKKTEDLADSCDKQAELMHNRQRLAQELYGALEWGFRYLLSFSKAETLEGVLSQNSYLENGILLGELARKLGLDIDSVGPMLQVPPGRIRALREGTIDMQPLLALAIAGAANDPHHRFRELASQCGDWLGFLRDLKSARDSGAHGRPLEADCKTIELFRHRTYYSLRVLLPDLQNESKDPPERRAQPESGYLYDERLRIRISLDERFGVQGFALLDATMAELLVQVQTETIDLTPGSTEVVEAAHLIVNLASILQHVVHRLILRSRGKAVRVDRVSIADVLKRADESGFNSETGDLPRSITSVNHNRVRRALRGLNPSLGACLVAFVLAASVDQLRDVAKRLPNLILLCGRLLELRGHGNHSIRLLTKDMISLRDDVYEVCKVTMEV